MAAASPELGAQPIDFSRDIRPILSDNCFACHGPDDGQRMADLRLDTKEGAFADRGGYRVIVPGKASESRLYQRISHEQEIARMPPPGFERSLSKEQIELIGRWIDQGANWQSHWAYERPRRTPLPAVQDAAWPRNAIDYFILARLEQEGLAPSPEADKATLLRRVTFDLTGLPPKPAEVEAFLADSSADAYQKVVDRLLDSPHYGERMAMQWLDLARYADTHGYHIDSYRHMWHWRDWVIRAFNDNLPFDKFTTYQLAGDLLPNATKEQKIATGFNRNHMINFEGGAIPEEYQTEYVIDRIETTSTVWMGMTMGCARCHDHKYDPIKQQEFYRFYAYFNSIPERGLDGQTGNAMPVLKLPLPEQEQRLEEIDQQIALKRRALPDWELASRQLKWEETSLATVPDAPRDALIAHYEFDGHLADTSGHYRHPKAVHGDLTYSPGRVAKAANFDGESHIDLGNVADFDSHDPFSISFWMQPSARPEKSVIRKLSADDAPRGFEIVVGEIIPLTGKMKREYDIWVRLMHAGPGNAIEIRTKQPLIQSMRRSSWRLVSVTYDGSGRAAGLRLYINGKLREVEVLHDNLSGSIRTSASLGLGNKGVGKPYGGLLDDLRFYGRVLTPQEIDALAVDHPMRPALAAELRTCEQEDAIRDYYLTHVAPEPYRQTYADLKALRAEKKELEDRIPTTMVMEEMDEPRETFVLKRGDYRNQTTRVEPGVPAVLPPIPSDAPANRLTLAKWLVDPAHPLTARVTVNRYWQMYFGAGLVRTSEDFGSQGEMPSHPRLLDWLATEFVRSGWDIKAMQRLIVTSAAYRQSSRVTPALLERDSENRLLARGPRFRLPAEMVRDNALAVSGLLSEEIGGPSVAPYQPKGLWEEMAFGDVFTAQQYEPGKGSDLYRRSLYTVWKRTVPPPSLATFDAPDREKCTTRRARTNTPLQALVLMNDPTYVEAARALAERMIGEAGNDPAERIRYGYQLAMAREPSAAERDVLLSIADEQGAEFRRDPEAARELLAVGESPYNPARDVPELAAWTTVASTLLNLDETITKE